MDMLVRIANIITDGTMAKRIPYDYADWHTEMSISEVPYPECAVPLIGSAYFQERAHRQAEPAPLLRGPIYRPSGPYRRGKCPTKRMLG